MASASAVLTKKIASYELLNYNDFRLTLVAKQVRLDIGVEENT